MEKLSKSQSSKEYLERKTGVKSEVLTEEVQNALKEAGQAANEKIARNNSVYQQSNSRSHLYSVETSSEEYDNDFYQRYFLDTEGQTQDLFQKPNQKIKK